MSFICLLKKISFGLLFLVISVVSAFGMQNLAKLSLEEASNLWRGGVLTTIHKIEIKHEHKHGHKLAEWHAFQKASIEFDSTGEFIRIWCVYPEKAIEYYVIYDIAKQEQVDSDINFISCRNNEVFTSSFGFILEKGVLLKGSHSGLDGDGKFNCEVVPLREKTKKWLRNSVEFGWFCEHMRGDQTSKSQCTDIGVYDFLYKNLLFRVPIKRTKACNLAVNHNNSMIATNLDDGKDTIVILYPQLLNFLKFKIHYDININYE